jgi:exonuclease III
MTFNTDFLWDGVEPEEGSANFPWKGSQFAAEEHMQRLAEVIIRNNPDVVNLVEVENIAALTAFNDQFLAGRGYRPYLVNGRDTSTGQDVALLTRIDPEGDAIDRDDRRGESGEEQKSVSKNYFATLHAGSTKFLMVGVHLLAFPLRDDRRLAREAQADAIRSIVKDKRCSGCEVVVLGDFNDYDDDPAATDHISSLPVTNVLRIVRTLQPQTSADDLVNAASFLRKVERYTAFHDANENGKTDPPGEFTSIDHVLLSSGLAARVSVVRVDHTHDPTQVSDHSPLIVRLELGPGAPTPPAAAGIRLVALLPNPSGNENGNEEATVRNTSGQAASLAGWKLSDLAGQTWSLDALGTLQAGQAKTIRRGGQRMAMNNGGDTIGLLNDTGTVVQSVTYQAVEEGERVIPW